MNASRSQLTRKLVITAMLTALVIILQFVSMNLRFSMFSITLTLVPIVLGAALCGVSSGAWLGFVFGIVVLLTGDANAFLAVNVPGTIITVLVKGTMCGLFAGLVYKALARFNKYVAVAAAALASPIANTGIFLIGCSIFFMPTITEWAASLGFGDNVGKYMIVGLVGINFLIELAINVVLTPVIIRLLNIRNKY
ncbi:MAG: ECF transporter S component [Clostridia bacterium]|nr:ECF transporter S component [Clostridia bacterium]